MKLVEALKHLEEGKAIRRALWRRANIFVQKAEGFHLPLSVPEEFSVLWDGKHYGFAFVEGVRLHMANGLWSVPWFCGLFERRVSDWEIVENVLTT